MTATEIAAAIRRMPEFSGADADALIAALSCKVSEATWGDRQLRIDVYDALDAAGDALGSVVPASQLV